MATDLALKIWTWQGYMQKTKNRLHSIRKKVGKNDGATIWQIDLCLVPADVWRVSLQLGGPSLCLACTSLSEM